MFKMFGSIDIQKKVNTSGIGLGLVISKLICLQFDGDVDYYTQPDRGSTFFFTFGLEKSENYSQSKIKIPKSRQSRFNAADVMQPRDKSESKFDS